MSFDATPITSYALATEGDSLRLSWTSTAAAGSTYQVYEDRVLAWHGTSLSVVLPYPSEYAHFDVGVVDPADAATDYSSGLPAVPMRKVTLAWMGDRTQSATLDRFDIYRSPAAVQPVSYAARFATLPAYEGGIGTDGWNAGIFNSGTTESTSSSYSWTSPPLGPGSWTFGVVSVDAAGNFATPGQEITQAISVPPRPPAANANRSRLACTYAQSTATAVLSWNPSPSY